VAQCAAGSRAGNNSPGLRARRPGAADPRGACAAIQCFTGPNRPAPGASAAPDAGAGRHQIRPARQVAQNGTGGDRGTGSWVGLVRERNTRRRANGGAPRGSWAPGGKPIQGRRGVRATPYNRSTTDYNRKQG